MLTYQKGNVASFGDILYFVEKFKLDYDPPKVNALSEQCLDYQMLNDHDIPNSVWQNTCNYYDEKPSTSEMIFYRNTSVK